MGLSTFHSLNTAARGLEAARAQIAITAQNTANAGTVGYTRQSAQLQSLPGVQSPGLFPNPAGVGQGVEVAGIGRSASELVNGQVRNAVAKSSYLQISAEAYSGVEDILREPGDYSVSTAVNSYHSTWQEYANNPGDTGAGTALLEAAKSLANRLNSDVQKLQDQRTTQVGELHAEVGRANTLAEQLAVVNGAILTTGAAGGSTNELLDTRDQIAEQLSSLTGGQLRPNANGTADFLVGGNALVSGDTNKELGLGEDPNTGGPRIVWTHRAGSPGVDGGSIAGRLAVLSADGPLQKAVDAYNTLATDIATKTNALHSDAETATGAKGGDLFGINANGSLEVLITDPTKIAHAAPGAGALDGSRADEIGALGEDITNSWTGFVSGVGASSRGALDNLSLSVGTESSARSSQLSLASVDRDEEAVNLVTFQHAYQASARVLTAIDEMLDTLINRVGLVGR